MSSANNGSAAKIELSGESPIVSVITQYIKDLSFENPKMPYEVPKDKQFNCELSIDIKTKALKTTGAFEVSLCANVKAFMGEDVIFITELEYAGLFSVNVEALDSNQLELALFVHCPTLLFPYIRRIISDISRDGGYPPLMLVNVDFFALFLKKKKQLEEENTHHTIN
ncbi:MAG: protein-export chaperone SecB [Proteobacteria bacterium]|nr:protein-export chaperone SecB [Pseudomonadota bacterium]